MKLSDLLKPKESISGAYEPGGFFNPQAGPLANKVLQTSINKSSPGFKQTTMNQSGTPVSTDVKSEPTIPQPEPIRDTKGNAIATPVDWYSEYAYRAQKGDTNAQDWINQNTIDEPVEDSSQYDFSGNDQIDFSTPTSGVAYSMEKLNELYGTKSPEDLWSLRQKLRFQQSQASAGDLPASEYMNYQGLPGLQGEKGYTYDQQMGINRSTADIFGTQVSDLDKFMDDFSKGKKESAAAGGLSFGGMEPWQQSIINATSVGSTKDERNANRQDLIMAASQGADSFVQALIGKGEANLKGTQLDEFNSRITNVSALQAALSSLESSGVKLSNFRSVKNKAEQIFGKQSTEYAAVQMLFEQVSASERNKIFGASLTGNEQAAANKFVINDKDTNETAMMKANKMIGVMNYANDIAALKATGATRQKIKEWQDAGYLKTFDEYTGTPSSTGTTTKVIGGKKYKVYPDGSAEEIGFNQVGSGTNKASKVVAGYDISSYATDPNHERSVATIYQRTPQFKSPTDIDMVIRKVAPRSKITGNMIATAANTYGVDPKMVYAIMLQDSSLGTAGMGARNNNPGNIGQYDHLGRPVPGYQTLQGGVNAVAKWLSKKKVNQSKSNYA